MVNIFNVNSKRWNIEQFKHCNYYLLIYFLNVFVDITGQWSDYSPVCEIVKCVEPNPILHGSFHLSNSIIYGSTMSYVCDEGYELFGDTSRGLFYYIEK